MVIVEYDDRTIGDVIQSLRENQKMTQTELAKRADVSRCAINNYEHGWATPSIQLLRKIMHVLGVDEVRISI